MDEGGGGETSGLEVGKRCSPVDVGSDREVLVELLEGGERHFVLGVR